MSLMRMMIFMICELSWVREGGRYLGKGVHSIKGLLRYDGHDISCTFYF